MASFLEVAAAGARAWRQGEARLCPRDYRKQEVTWLYGYDAAKAAADELRQVAHNARMRAVAAKREVLR